MTQGNAKVEILGAVRKGFSATTIAWTAVLIFSDLPDAIWQALAGVPPTWLFWAKVGGLLAIILLGRVSKPLYYLRPFFLLMLIFGGGRKAMSSLGMSLGYVQGGDQSGLPLRMANYEGLRLLVAAVMVAALLVMGKRRQDFYLAKGDLTRWKRPGIILALALMVITFFFFDYNLPSAATLMKALPWMPAFLLWAALGSFDEEVRCRATLLPVLQDVVGNDEAILITSFYFGISHYFSGVPAGVEGFFITAALGWLYAIMMVETRGVSMSWINHFLADVPSYLFWAIVSISG